MESFLSICRFLGFLDVARRLQRTADPWRKLGARRGIKRRNSLAPFSTRSECLPDRARAQNVRAFIQRSDCLAGSVIPGRAEGANPESRRIHGASIWIPGPPFRGVPE
jgi:hypothetical protein